MARQSQPAVNHRHTRRSITKSTSLLVPVMMTRIPIHSLIPPITVVVREEPSITQIKTSIPRIIMAEIPPLFNLAPHSQAKTIITGTLTNLAIPVIVKLIAEIMGAVLVLRQQQILLVIKKFKKGVAIHFPSDIIIGN